MLYEQTREHIRRLTDDALVEYLLVGTATYESDAVAFAWEEFDQRKLDPQLIASLSADADARRESNSAAETALATRPLGFLGRVLTLLGGIVLGPIIGVFAFALIGDIINNTGKDIASRDMWVFAVTGFAVQIILIIGLVTESNPYFILAVAGTVIALAWVWIWKARSRPQKRGFDVILPGNGRVEE